jgi:hypothetical protein
LWVSGIRLKHVKENPEKAKESKDHVYGIFETIYKGYKKQE